MINTFAKLGIKGVNPALPTSFVVPTYTLLINMVKGEMTIEHTRHRFRNVFPTDLSTTCIAGIIVRCGSEMIKRNESTLTCNNSFCKKPVFLRCPRYEPRWGHGWWKGKEGKDGGGVERKGGVKGNQLRHRPALRSLGRISAYFKNSNPCLIPWVFMFPNRGRETRAKISRRRKNYPLEIFSKFQYPTNQTMGFLVKTLGI